MGYQYKKQFSSAFKMTPVYHVSIPLFGAGGTRVSFLIIFVLIAKVTK